MPLARSSFCTGLKKLQKASQVFGASDSLKPALVTRSPQIWNGERRLLDRRKIEGALLRGAVVERGVQQRGLAEPGLVLLHDVAHVHQLIVPGVLRQYRCRRVVENQVRDLAAGDRGYRLLVQRLERHDAEVDLVAAGLLVVGNRLAESGVLLGDETLYLPDCRGRRRRIRDIGTCQGPCCRQTQRSTNYRTPAHVVHGRSPSLMSGPDRSGTLVMAALSAFLTSSVWQLAGCGQLIAALGDGMDVAYEGKKEGFHTESTEKHGAPPRGLSASRKVPAPSSVALRVSCGPPCETLLTFPSTVDQPHRRQRSPSLAGQPGCRFFSPSFSYVLL